MAPRALSRDDNDATWPPQTPLAAKNGATHEHEPATHEVIMSKSAI
jgi:hypothetical protein